MESFQNLHNESKVYRRRYDQEGRREIRGETAPELNSLDDIKLDIFNITFSNYLKLIIILKDYFCCLEKIG